MKAAISAYPSYQNTGLQWASRVPAHWEIRRLKYLVHERVQKGFPNEPLLAATQTRGVIPKSDYGLRTVEAQKDLHLLKLVEPGDYVISLRSFQGGIEFAHHRGIISPAYTVLRPIPGVERSYFEYFFKSANFVSSMSLFVTGIREGQNIDYVRLSRAYMPLPPPDEQEAMGHFIRYIDQRVNRLLKTKRRLIELLNEQKQAIIHRAVTRGLDPDVPLKPSGVEWLGDVPEHWEVRKLRYLATKFGSGVTPRGGSQIYVEDGVPFLRSQNIHFDGLRLNVVARIPREIHAELSGTHVKPNDVLLNITGASIGRVCFVPGDFEDGNVSQHVCIIRPRQKVAMAAFIAAVLSSPAAQYQLYLSQNGSSREGLTLRAIKGFSLPLPSIAEQDAIIHYIAREAAPFDHAITKAQAEIDFIREYRTRLVSDVVTGQLDVRGLALPEVEEEVVSLENEGDELDEGANEDGEGAEE